VQFNTASWSSCSMPRASCSAHYKAGCRTSGIFKINPFGTSINAYCDMSASGGGWTRLNSNLATATNSFGANDLISSNNIGQGCGGTTPSLTLTNVNIPHTQGMIIFTRTTTIMQCPGITNMASSTSAYLNGSTWVSSTTCTWATPWTSGVANDISATGLPYSTWLVTGNISISTMAFTSICSNSSDNGAYTMQFFVK